MDSIESAAIANIPKKLKIYVNKSESDKVHVKDDDDDNAGSLWWTLPQLVLTEIFWLLPVKDILNAGLTCRRWYEVANDEYLWKRKFHRHFKTDPCIALKPGVRICKCLSGYTSY